MPSASASASRVGTDHGSLPRKSTRTASALGSARQAPLRRRILEPQLDASKLGQDRSPTVVVEAIDEQHALEMVGLVLEDASQQTLPRELEGDTVNVVAAARDPRVPLRLVVRAGDREAPLLLEELPLALESTGFAMNDGPVCPSSKVNTRSEMPTCGPASPTPGASYIVSSMSSRRVRRVRSNVVTGLAGSRSTGSPRMRIGMITGRRSRSAHR